MSNVLDIIGPVMVGPSSSHTAGAARLGAIARALLCDEVTAANVTLYGSFAKTGRGHGTDRAIVAGVLGMATDDVRLRDSLAIARDRGVAVSFAEGEADGLHPNTALIELAGTDGAHVSMLGSSVGGGQVLVSRIDGMQVRLTGLRTTFVVRHVDAPGLIARVTEVLAGGGANICDFSLSRQERGGVAVMTIEVEGNVGAGAAARIEAIEGVERCIELAPVCGDERPFVPAQPAPDVAACEGDFLYARFADVVAAAERSGVSVGHVVLAQQARAMELAPEELYARMAGRLSVMRSCIAPGSDPNLRSASGLCGGDAHRMLAAAPTSVMGGRVAKAVGYALAVSELNAAMGRVVAAPTAGSCGILPAAVLAVGEELGAGERDCVMALFTAAAVGLVIEHNATLAGAEGGCQAETGAAAAMAAAAVVELAGGSPAQAAAASSLAIQGLLGLVCDPVGGLVEVPCVKRNATGVTVALTCADMALAGIGETIPFDDAVLAMKRVGASLPAALRETGEGGLAATPCGRDLAAHAFGCAACGATRA